MKRRTIWKVRRRIKGSMREIGSWHYTLPGGERVNTRTDDADKALKMRAGALKKFKGSAAQTTDSQGAAEATIAALDGAGDLSNPSSEPPPPEDTPPAAVEAPAAAPALRPDAYAPPPAAGDWAGDAARAAAGASGLPDAPDIDPQFLESLLEDGAAMAVELQIRLQAWAIARGVKLKAAVVADDNRGRAKGKEIWAKQFRLWMPSDINLPGYLAAPIAVAVGTLPAQLEGATPLPKEEKKQDDGQPPEAAGVGA